VRLNALPRLQLKSIFQPSFSLTKLISEVSVLVGMLALSFLYCSRDASNSSSPLLRREKIDVAPNIFEKSGDFSSTEACAVLPDIVVFTILYGNPPHY
jgi:hypothetical protein